MDFFPLTVLLCLPPVFDASLWTLGVLGSLYESDRFIIAH